MFDPRIDKQFFNIKIGRRILALFVCCAVVPLVVISAVSYFFVNDQLESQAIRRMRQYSKNKGFEIYDHLLSLDSELQAWEQNISKKKSIAPQWTPYNPATREGSRFRQICFFDADGRSTQLAGESGTPPCAQPAGPAGQTADKPWITTTPNDAGLPSIFLARTMRLPDGRIGTFSGLAEPLFLWGVGSDNAMPPDTEMTIWQPPDQILASSFAQGLADDAIIATSVQTSASGTYENDIEGRPYIHIFWSLFLRNRFASPDWVIVFSQPRQAIMAPVAEFGTYFFLLLLLTFWLILLASIVSIRKRMVPVQKLKTSARKVAAGQYGHQVDVKTGDEFETLADTFNEMSRQLKKDQAMMVQAAKMSAFGQMAAGIVHEIGQPLNAISGYNELLLMDIVDEKQQRMLNITREQIDRLRAIISKFRNFSRQSGETSAPVQINAVLVQIHELLAHQLKIKSVQVDMSLDEHLPTINGDNNALQQVMMNQTVNAIDALEENPKDSRMIRISSSVEQEAICVKIEDNGCGIPEDLQQSIFEPFFTTKGEDKGTGLGLAIITSILHKHHAHIDLRSRIGEGTCFTISFPVGEKSSDMNEPPKSSVA